MDLNKPINLYSPDLGIALSWPGGRAAGGMEGGGECVCCTNSVTGDGKLPSLAVALVHEVTSDRRGAEEHGEWRVGLPNVSANPRTLATSSLPIRRESARGCAARPMAKRSAAEAALPSDPNPSPLADFQTTEVIREESGFCAVAGELKGVRTLLKVRRQEPEVSMPTVVAELPWQLQSESGAEYSYYSATRSAVVSTEYAVEMISPASDAKIDRERPQKSFYIEESAETYAAVSRPLIEAQLSKDEAKLRAKLSDRDVIHSRIGWLHNVLSGAKERERVLHTDDTFLMNVDTKWATHPDCNSSPREEWHGHPSTDELYCLAIVRDTALPTLRELRGCHLPMLRAILGKGRDTIKQVRLTSTCSLATRLAIQL